MQPDILVARATSLLGGSKACLHAAGLRACAQKAVSCTKSCSGQEVVNNLLRLASVAELSVPEGMLNE